MGEVSNYNDVHRACDQNNRDYFETHAKELSASYLPPEAIPAIVSMCGAPGLVLTLTPVGKNVSVKAAWTPVGTTQVHVSSLTYSSNLKCKVQNLRKLRGIGNAPVGDVCERTSNDPVLVSLQTREGGYVMDSLPGVDTSKYSLLIYAADDNMKCFVNDTQVGEINMGSRDTPQPPIDLNQHFRSGDNTIRCTPVDVHPNGAFQPCWWYRYAIQKDGVNVVANQSGCCGSGCPAQPPQPSPLIVRRP